MAKSALCAVLLISAVAIAVASASLQGGRSTSKGSFHNFQKPRSLDSLKPLGFSPTPLDNYVNANDGYFNFWYSGVTRSGEGWTAYMYNLTSQKWFDANFSSKPIWTHQVAIIVPHDVNKSLDSAFVYMTGHGTPRNGSWPDANDEGLLIAAEVALAAKSPGAVVWQIPDECIVFFTDPLGKNNCRSEDAAIAWTWWAFTHPDRIGATDSNPEWILEFPMTKAGVKALDMLEQTIHLHTGGVVVKGFYVSGASKRGWTTWLVGATGGSRVRGIMPIVLDALNVVEFAHRQFQFYGAWTFALEDYYRMNFTQDLDLPQTQKLMQNVDPWYYRQRLTMPKLAINAVGDEFQMPDDQRHWAPYMPGEMNLLMVKNAEHSMATGVLELMQSAGAFLQACQQNYARPSYSWSIDETTGAITVTTPIAPSVITVAYAKSPTGVSAGRRDFRWAAINASWCIVKVFGACVRPVIWKTTLKYVTQINATTWQAQMDAPTDGTWLGFMVEMQWPNPSGPDDFYFTTPVSVIPNTKPFAPCSGAECRGYLI